MDLKEEKRLRRNLEVAKSRYERFRLMLKFARLAPVAILTFIVIMAFNSGWAIGLGVVCFFYVALSAIAYGVLNFGKDYGTGGKTYIQSAKYNFEDAQSDYSEFIMKQSEADLDQK